jgi:hypothetical protein
MASFSQEFRKLGEYLRDLPLKEIQANIRSFAGSLGEFSKDVVKGGAAVLGEIAGGIKGLVDALSGVNDATGGVLGQIAKGLFALGAALAFVAAGPAVAISAAITSLLWAVAKFQEWKAGGSNALSDFFDTIAGAANKAKEAVDALLAALKSIPGLPGINGTPNVETGPAGAGTAPGSVRPLSIPERMKMLDQLRQKQGEMSPGTQGSKLASDRAATINTDNSTTTNEQKNSFSVAVTANGLGEVAAAAASGVRTAASNIRMMTSTAGGAAP